MVIGTPKRGNDVQIGEYIMQWIELHMTDSFKGENPMLLIPANKRICSECKGVKPLGKSKGLAYCSLLNGATHDVKYLENIHFCMDRRTTQSLCLREGVGCPIKKEPSLFGNERAKTNRKETKRRSGNWNR